MRPIKCHRKYPITTNFLDTMLEHFVDIQEGESKLDAYRRGLKELDQIAAELRKEANPEVYPQPYNGRDRFHELTSGQLPPAELTFANGSLPIISKDRERMEIDIDNAQTVEDLKKAKGESHILPASLVDHYNKRMAELLSERPKDFVEGLE